MGVVRGAVAIHAKSRPDCRAWNSNVAEKGVPFDLVTDCGFRSMARQHARGRIEWEDFFADPLEEKWSVTARQIPASHALPEEHIARHQ